jgi:MoCo/4Fe-4S cofactor protein with predicted Tat translocation signal
MKRQFQHPAPSERALSGPQYWRSLDELAATPGFQAQVEREFPEGASTLDGVNRRGFMKIMAASFALGGLGLAGCRRPEKFILPYGKSVEGVIPGLPLYFATSLPLRKAAIPLLAETHQGRPTKIEGNPSYAPHGTASSLLAQASVLDLYDPERSMAHTKGGAKLDAAAVNALLAGLAATPAGGAGLAFLADESSSPTRARLVAALRQRFPQAVWAEYEPVTDMPPAAASVAVFGNANLRPLYRFAGARRVVSLDADFMQSEAGSIGYARAFAAARKVLKKDDPMNRLYMAESGLSLTGAMADHRLRLASSHMEAFAAALSAKVAGTAAPAAAGLNQAWIDACAEDLLANRGSSLLIAGSHLPVSVHALAYRMNVALGNVGRTIDFVEVPAAPAAATITQLATAINGGSVRTLVILGGNPAYNAPADLDWAATQKKVADVIHLSGYVDETSSLAGTHLSAAHYLESWGDARTVDGTIVPVQPMIVPLFGGLTQIEVLARIAGQADADPYALVRATITAIAGGDAEKAMQKFLHDGVLANSAYRVVGQVQATGTIPAVTAPVALSAANLEVRFVADAKMDDGRFANNGWLQECPDPITKISWDNAILISPKLGKELGIDPKGALLQVARKEEADFSIGKENAPIAELTIGNRKIRGPVHIQPGLSNYTVVLPLGYGRTVTGHVGRGAGFNAYPLRTAAAPHFATGGKLALTGERLLLANTQEHWSMEGRDIVREANLDEVQKEGSAGLGYVKGIGMESHTPAVLGGEGARKAGESEADYQKRIHGGVVQASLPRGQSLYSTPNFDGTHQWGMSVDLNVCTGCAACVVACQAENNIPIVGKDQVLRGREMHWIRLDRYYSSGTADAGAFGGEGNRELPEDPQVSLQPMACQHCELAPCETVCPVNATVHDNEGVNTMAYNRCIGTRYCANNCPYKTRRFNFFDFNERQLDSLYMGPAGPQGMPELVKMVKNPEVTVRMRGVMEKCTYCIQRIQNAKIQHRAKSAQDGNPSDVIVPDGTIKVACQQVCPVEAIEFGNILDPQSRVSQAKAREQDYAVLGYLNIRPRTTYLGKLRNPNPKMPDYAALPLSRTEYNEKNHPAHHAEPAAAGAGAAVEKGGAHH